MNSRETLNLMEEHPQARFIVETLAKEGFIAYYAGGWVRDFLLQHPSDDIDIATNAPPETIQALFPHTVPIGISFGIILVIIDGHQYEVATFRKDFDYSDARRPSRIEFSSPIEDAKRRDFTINGMFFDPLKEEILDFVGGKEDLQKGIIRAIGDPHERIREDRLRMIRAVRLACRFGFTIEEKTKKAIIAHRKELFPAVAIERVVQELEKGRAFKKLFSFVLALHEFFLLQEIFPELGHISLEELKQRILPMEGYPKEVPLIGSILALFPDFSFDEAEKIAKRLKISNRDLVFLSSLFAAKKITEQKEVSPFEWCLFYAKEFSPLCLALLRCHLEKREGQEFLQEHEKRRTSLQFFIERMVNKDPIVRAKDLALQGILPGKAMGDLLRELEKLAVNENIRDKDTLLKRLKDFQK